MNRYARFFLAIVFITGFPDTMLSQDNVNFKVQEQLFLKGNSILIGNTVLGKDRTLPFNDVKIPNDAVDMKYVDVDLDKTTFSSSSAQIVMPVTTQRIVYAGLYWSGLYPSERSIMRKGSRRIVYKSKGGRVSSVNEIKIKTSEDAYLDIKGEIIFDAKNKGTFKKDSPYLCRADITSYLNERPFQKTVFTVANIRGVNGKIAGGSAAGWLLYVIYEDASETPKFFTTYDGFQQVSTTAMDIVFDDFQVKTEGETVSTLVMASLEGDVNIKTDQCTIYNPKTKNYTSLKTSERAATNFFNSSITNSNKTKSERTPASKNTLGFDLVKMKLPSGIISNNATTAKVRFKTETDRFYLFFTAFETEIEESYLSKRNSEIAFQMGSGIENQIPQELETTPKEPSEQMEAIGDVFATTNTTDADEITNISIAGMAKGYYLVTNVFSRNDYGIKWTEKLLEQGYSPKSYINPENGWTYIYVEMSNNLDEILDKKEALRALEQFKDAWVSGINR